ncbi:MAG: hypothetical protein AB7L65_08305 [Hyphomonadaceae bacterium]
MFFAWFALAVAVIALLSWLGAHIARRAPGTEWEKDADRPILPGDHW